MYMCFTHTQPWTDTVCSSQGLELCGIIPVCITSAMCSGQTKEMNLCGADVGLCPSTEPQLGKRVTPRANTSSKVFPTTIRATAHPKSHFPEQTGLIHGPAWPGHDPSPQINQLQLPSSAQRSWSTTSIGSTHSKVNPAPSPSPCNAPFVQSAFQTEM